MTCVGAGCGTISAEEFRLNVVDSRSPVRQGIIDALRDGADGLVESSTQAYDGLPLTLTHNSFSSTAYTTHSHSQLGYRTGASRGSEHVHHGAPSFLSWRGIVFDRAHSVVLCSTRMTHGVEGLITPSSAETHTH